MNEWKVALLNKAYIKMNTYEYYKLKFFIIK